MVPLGYLLSDHEKRPLEQKVNIVGRAGACHIVMGVRFLLRKPILSDVWS